MKFKVYHGPNKNLVEFDREQGEVTGSYRPFLGIISRGLLNQLNKVKDLDLSDWYANAHMLESQDRLYHPGTNIELRELYKWHTKCLVLTFSQTVEVLFRYFESKASELKDNTGDKVYELWNIKEGHTSSVWKITSLTDDIKETNVINIARDTEAGLELLRTSSTMKRIGDKYPDINLAKVGDIKTIPLKMHGRDTEVVVVQNEWIEDAIEVHKVNDEKSRTQKFLLVERFITDTVQPSRIKGVKGRYLNGAEKAVIERDISDFLDLATSVVDSTELEINDGDVVWNGQRAFIVAIS